MERKNVLNDVLALRWLGVFMLFVLMLSTRYLLAQQRGFAFAPGGLMFRPLVASQFEPRLGLEKDLDTNLLTLNIGNSLDVCSWRSAAANAEESVESQWRIGGDLFTWTQIRSEHDLRFPVENVDYLFGVNATWEKNVQAIRCAPVVYSFRLRLAHVSAHTVDGMYDNYTKQFVYQEPFTYSQEFLDGVFSYASQWRSIGYRALLGGKLIVHSIPGTLTAFSLHYGFELHAAAIVAVAPYIAYDGRLQKIAAWAGVNSAQAGVKFGEWDGGGVSLYAAYFQGKNVHGELYDVDARYVSFGMNFSF